MSVTSLSSDVNFIPEDIVHSRQREKYRKKGFFVGLSFVLIALIIGIALYVYNSSTEKKIDSYKKQLDENLVQIETLQDVGESGYKLGRRLNEIKGIINQRRLYSNLLTTLLAKSPSTIEIKGIEVDGNDVIYTGYTPETYSPIAELKGNILNIGNDLEDNIFNTANFEKATLDDEDNRITFTVGLELKEGGLNDRID